MPSEKKQDKDVENLEGELGQYRDKYKGKASFGILYSYAVLPLSF